MRLNRNYLLCLKYTRLKVRIKKIIVWISFSEKVWTTDLDWLIPPQDRMIILHFLTGGAVNASSAAHTTPTPFHHPAAQIREYLEAEDTWWPCSPEFINYALALLVYSVRYPAVFWNTNKGFSFLFSLQAWFTDYKAGFDDMGFFQWWSSHLNDFLVIFSLE